MYIYRYLYGGINNMSSPLGIIEDISDEYNQNWSERTLLEIMSDYIENQMDNGTFIDFILSRIDLEK